MFWVRPWSSSSSTGAAVPSSDQLARCPLPVFGWPMSAGGIPWAMPPPNIAQNYAKYAGHGSLPTQQRQSPAHADKCSDISDNEREDHDASRTSLTPSRHEVMRASAKQLSRSAQGPVDDSARRISGEWNDDEMRPEKTKSHSRDAWNGGSGTDRRTPSNCSSSGSSRRRSASPKQHAYDATYEPSDLRTSRSATDATARESMRDEDTNRRDTENNLSPSLHGDHEGKLNVTTRVASGHGITSSSNDQHLQDSASDDDEDCRRSRSVSRRSSPLLEIKTQRPLGLLAQHGLVAKSSSSHLLSDSLKQQQQQQQPQFIDYTAQYQSLLAAHSAVSGASSLNLNRSTSSPSSIHHWTFEEQFKQLYELSPDVKRREFLDELFSFMQKRGTPVNRIPIMAKRVLDLYELYRLVVSKGGLVEVINKKLWREITKELNLPSSITSAAFTLRTQYMKYIYPYECEKLKLSSPAELQMAIDGNRREGRRPSYGGYDFPQPGDGFLSSPLSGLANGRQASPAPSSRSRDGDDESPSPSNYLMANSDPSRARPHTNPMDRTAPPPLRLANPADSHHLPPHPFISGSHHSPLTRAHRPSLAESHLFFSSQERAASPPLPRSFYSGEVGPAVSASLKNAMKERSERSSPLTLSPSKATISSSARDTEADQQPPVKRFAMDDNGRMFYPFGLPTAHFQITSRSDGRSEFDNSIVVSMEINGMMYQGVLFSKQAARRH